MRGADITQEGLFVMKQTADYCVWLNDFEPGQGNQWPDDLEVDSTQSNQWALMSPSL